MCIVCSYREKHHLQWKRCPQALNEGTSQKSLAVCAVVEHFPLPTDLRELFDRNIVLCCNGYCYHNIATEGGNYRINKHIDHMIRKLRRSGINEFKDPFILWLKSLIGTRHNKPKKRSQKAFFDNLRMEKVSITNMRLFRTLHFRPDHHPPRIGDKFMITSYGLLIGSIVWKNNGDKITVIDFHSGEKLLYLNYEQPPDYYGRPGYNIAKREITYYVYRDEEVDIYSLQVVGLEVLVQFMLCLLRFVPTEIAIYIIRSYVLSLQKLLFTSSGPSLRFEYIFI